MEKSSEEREEKEKKERRKKFSRCPIEFHSSVRDREEGRGIGQMKKAEAQKRWRQEQEGATEEILSQEGGEREM